MRLFHLAAAMFAFFTTGALAQSCGKAGNLEFQAKTDEGWAAPPHGMLVKLEKQQCGVDALWVPAELVKNPAHKNCRFGAIWSVAGQEIKDAPANYPVKGKILTITKAACK
jgi:hypothetical protein